MEGAGGGTGGVCVPIPPFLKYSIENPYRQSIVSRGSRFFEEPEQNGFNKNGFKMIPTMVSKPFLQI